MNKGINYSQLAKLACLSKVYLLTHKRKKSS